MKAASFKRGFTIVELLIVATLFTIIGAVVASLFTRGTSTYKHGETHIEMQRAGRHIVGRLTPFFSSAFTVEGNLSQTPIIDTSTAGQVTFSTTEDWFSPNYPSQTTSARLATSVSDLNEYYYRVRQDGGEGDIFLEKLQETLPRPATGPRQFTVAESLRILRQKKNERVKNLRFTQVRSNLLLMEFETAKLTRGDDDDQAGTGEIRATEEFRVTYNLPKTT